jgi:hypothetical protein
MAVNWREHYSTRGSSKGGLEEEVVEVTALGSGVWPRQLGDTNEAQGPVMEEWYGNLWSSLRLRDIGRWSNGGRQMRRWPGPEQWRHGWGHVKLGSNGEVARCRGKNEARSLLYRKKRSSREVA